MDWQQPFHGFQLDDHLAIDDNVGSIRRLYGDTFKFNGNGDFATHCEAIALHSTQEAGAISRLEQSGSQRLVNLQRAAQDSLGQMCANERLCLFHRYSPFPGSTLPAAPR